MDKEAYFKGFQEEIEKVGRAASPAAAFWMGGYPAIVGREHAKEDVPLKKRHAFSRFATRHPFASMFLLPGSYGYTIGRLLGGEELGEKGKVTIEKKK